MTSNAINCDHFDYHIVIKAWMKNCFNIFVYHFDYHIDYCQYTMMDYMFLLDRKPVLMFWPNDSILIKLVYV